MTDKESVLANEPKLRIEYFSDTDTLVFTAEGKAGSNGETVGRNEVGYVVAFTDDEGDITGVTIERAAKLLGPYLTSGGVLI